MPTETSVALSLAELSRIEEERVEHEKAERARERSARAERERQAEARRRAEEEAKLRHEQAERAELVRREAMENAQSEARQRAELEVVRIQAEAKARLEADNAVRTHELAVLRTKRETGRRRREIVLGVALAVGLSLGGLGYADANARTAKYERTAEELRERERAVLRERDDAKRIELQSLERRQASLLARANASGAKHEREAAEAAHAAVDIHAPAQDRLVAFAESLDALDQRIDRLDQVALLDQRRDDLASWASSRRHTAELEQVKAAAERAKSQDAGPEAISAYERALDRLASTLGARSGSVGRTGQDAPSGGQQKCHDGDPGCGIDGRPLF
jgi:hypothetical protein